jgi:hypothetical protein
VKPAQFKLKLRVGIAPSRYGNLLISSVQDRTTRGNVDVGCGRGGEIKILSTYPFNGIYAPRPLTKRIALLKKDFYTLKYTLIMIINNQYSSTFWSGTWSVYTKVFDHNSHRRQKYSLGLTSRRQQRKMLINISQTVLEPPITISGGLRLSDRANCRYKTITARNYQRKI